MSSVSSSRIKVEVVCFSKERPFQLCECLSSLSQTVVPHDSYDLHTNVILDPKNYETHYMEVERRHPGVDFLYETKETDFLLLLHQILSPSSSSSSSSPSFVLFLVDDLIFHSSVNLIDFLTLLNHDPSLFNAHLKLHPGIQFSHPASKVNVPPQLHAFPSSSSALQFSLIEGTGDWAYPIDLCGGLYRTADLLSLLSHSRSHLDILPIRNPNTLEVSLNKAFQSSPELCMHKYSSSLCSSSPLLYVLTINRVQTTYNVPIYNSAYNDLELLNSFLYSERHFDLSKYAAMLSSSVHIGDVFFLESPSLSISIPYSSSSSPLISVLIPTFNAAKTIQQSILSILDSVTRYPFEVVIVNDGSNDNTEDILTSLQAIAASRSIPFQVLNTERKGLIDALETGLQHCSAPFIARMDADDIADSHRLDRQLRFLLANPVINVVGSQAALLTSSKEKGSFKEELLDVALMQIHPILIEWEMVHFITKSTIRILLF